MDRVSALVAEDFSTRPDVREACVTVIDYISNKPSENLKHLTFGMLAEIVGKGADPALLSTVIAYLAGDRARVLEMRFEFIDQDLIVPLAADILKQARREKEFFHPVKGVLVPDFERYIYIYFVPVGTPEEHL